MCLNKHLEKTSNYRYMISIKRIRCNEGGPFTPSTQEVNISLSDHYGICDLTTSEVVLRMRAYCSSNGTAGTLLPVTICQTGIDNYSRYTGGCQSLIRDARSTNRRYGQLERYLTNQNVLSANMDYYSLGRDQEKVVAQTFNGGSAFYDQNFLGATPVTYSPFLTQSKPRVPGTFQTALSVINDAEVRFPLSKVWKLAQSAASYPFSMMGGQDIKLNMEQLVSLLGVQAYDQSATLEDITAVASQVGSLTNPLLMEAEGHIPFTQQAMDEGLIPFSVGMPVKIDYQIGGNPFDVTTTISAMNVTTAGVLQIVLATPIATPNPTDALTDIEMDMYIDADVELTYVIKDIFVELHSFILTPNQYEAQLLKIKKNKLIPFVDTQVYRFTMPVTSYYSNTFQVDPNCMGIIALTPLNNTLISSWDNATGYMWEINSYPVLNATQIPCGQTIDNLGVGVPKQLHNLQLQRFFSNIYQLTGQRLLRFDGFDVNATATEGDNEYNNHCMYATTVPLMDMPSTIGFKLYSSTDMQTKNVYFFSFHLRSVDVTTGVSK